LARKIKTGDLFAVKVLKKSFIAGKNAVPHILAEKKILETSVSSPFIVKMYYAFQTSVGPLSPHCSWSAPFNLSFSVAIETLVPGDGIFAWRRLLFTAQKRWSL